MTTHDSPTPSARGRPKYRLRRISFDDPAFSRLREHRQMLLKNTGRVWTNSQALNHLLRYVPLRVAESGCSQCGRCEICGAPL